MGRTRKLVLKGGVDLQFKEGGWTELMGGVLPEIIGCSCLQQLPCQQPPENNSLPFTVRGQGQWKVWGMPDPATPHKALGSQSSVSILPCIRDSISATSCWQKAAQA